MSEFICQNCQALLGVGNVYCLNCGTPVVASVDDGPETVIRPAMPRAASNTASIAVGLAILVGGAAFMLYQSLPEKETPKSEPGAVATGFPASPTRTPTPAPTVAATRERMATTATPEPTPPVIDKMLADREANRINALREFEEQLRRQRERNMANAANAMRYSNRATNQRPVANFPANRPRPAILAHCVDGGRNLYDVTVNVRDMCYGQGGVGRTERTFYP